MQYNPNSTRNVLAVPDFRPPYPNTSHIEIGQRSERDVKHYETNYSNSYLRKNRSEVPTSHPGIQAFRNKWVRSRLAKWWSLMNYFEIVSMIIGWVVRGIAGLIVLVVIDLWWCTFCSWRCFTGTFTFCCCSCLRCEWHRPFFCWLCPNLAATGRGYVPYFWHWFSFSGSVVDLVLAFYLYLLLDIYLQMTFSFLILFHHY